MIVLPPPSLPCKGRAGEGFLFVLPPPCKGRAGEGSRMYKYNHYTYENQINLWKNFSY
jgi:hypothetical protein